MSDMKVSTPAAAPDGLPVMFNFSAKSMTPCVRQNPEWIGQNGDFSTGESYESRSVELLEFFSRFIFAAGLPWQGRNLLSRKR
jgi:hypothetical protein